MALSAVMNKLKFISTGNDVVRALMRFDWTCLLQHFVWISIDEGRKVETIGLCKFKLNFFVKLKWRNCLKTNLHLNLTDFIMTKSLVGRRLNFNVRQFIHRDYQLLRFKKSLMKFISNDIRRYKYLAELH